jgi:aminotransferase
MSPGFSSLIDDIQPSGIRRFFELVIDAKDVISLGVGEPDFSSPWPVRNAAIQAIQKGQTSYTSNKGLLSLRQKTSVYLKQRFGVDYQCEDEILITNGVSEAVDLVCRVILNPGDEVILPEPNYVCYSPLIRLAGGVPICLDTSHTEFIPRVKDVAALITDKTKAIVLCSPNNPTGAIIPDGVADGIAALAEKHSFWVISDEIYAELSYQDNYRSFSAIKGAKPFTILLNGFSKAFAMTGWRLGFIAGPKELVSRCLKIHQYSALCASIISQVAAEAAFDSKSDLTYMQESYKQRRNIFKARILAMGLDLVTPDGAFYAFVDIRSLGLSSEAFALQLLEGHRVAVVPGHVFGLGGEGFVRCCYATGMDDLITALNRMENFVKEMRC